MINAKIEAVVKNIGQETRFMQPIYEAIINSLEANASKIELTIFQSPHVEGINGKIEGFKIVDNGESFNEKNREAFSLLWTDNKISLGCKGSGRFTWLSVYESINVHSLVKSENVRVDIPFNLDFDKEKINIKYEDVRENYTEIIFKDVTKRFFYFDKDGKPIDNRYPADIKMIKGEIQDYLMVKLFLMKKNNIKFEIKIILENSYEIINNDSIDNLAYVEFGIKNPFNDIPINFYLYYQFKEDSKNSKKVFYCSNNRSTKKIDDDSLGFSSALPNKASFVMLLCSSYFDEKDDDSRSDLTKLSNLKSASLFNPLLLSDITPIMKQNMHKIIIQNYPQISIENIKAEDEAIDEAPYLSEFIKKDKDFVKSKDSLIKRAYKEFFDEKIRTKEKFEKALTSKQINAEEFKKAVNDISLIAAAELGEYVLYRNNIIKALKNSMDNPAIKEEYVHNIFMPMKTDSTDDEDKHFLSNLWLFDDKFMTYSYAASDKTINQICNAIQEKNDKIFKKMNRPDITVFYNNKCGVKDALMVEFKGINADKDEKNKSLSELPNDIAIIKNNIENLSAIWGYIVTSIDADFAFTIENDGRFIQLFTNDSSKKAYYGFFKNLNAHVYIIDLSIIVADSEARNKTFLDLLKK